MKDADPINVLSLVRNVPEVVNIYAATANPFQAVVVESEQGRGVLGVVDGFSPKGIETAKEVEEKKQFLRRMDYKL